MASIKIKLVKGLSGHLPRHRETIRGLGLARVGTTRIVPDTAATRGMVNQVAYLLDVSESSEQFKPFGRRRATRSRSKTS